MKSPSLSVANVLLFFITMFWLLPNYLGSHDHVQVFVVQLFFPSPSQVILTCGKKHDNHPLSSIIYHHKSISLQFIGPKNLRPPQRRSGVASSQEWGLSAKHRCDALTLGSASHFWKVSIPRSPIWIVEHVSFMSYIPYHIFQLGFPMDLVILQLYLGIWWLMGFPIT